MHKRTNLPSPLDTYKQLELFTSVARDNSDNLVSEPHDEVVYDSSGLNCLSDHRRRRDLPDV